MGDYSPEPPRKKCILHQTFDYYDEGSERYVDISPQQNDATVTGPDVIRTDVGVIGECAVFDTESSLEVSGIDSSRKYSELTHSSWFKPQRPVDSSKQNVTFGAKMENGNTYSLSHTVSEDVDGWQFAIATFDGQWLRLYYTRLGDELQQVDEADTGSDGDIEGRFRLTFTTNGDSFLDDVRLYETVFDEDGREGIYEIGRFHNSINDLRDAWDNPGIPFRGTNIDFGSTLAEEKDSVNRQLDYIRESRHIKDAGGKQLDRIGKIAGIKRKENEEDARYRARIIGTIAAGRSSGTFNDIVETTATILDTDPEHVSVQKGWTQDPTAIATAFIYVRSTDLDSSALTASDLTSILQDVVIAGHAITVFRQADSAFILIDDTDANSPENGLTSDSKSLGGGLASDV